MTTDLDHTLKLSPVANDELYLLQRFYRSNGHKGKIKPTETAFCLRRNDRILAVVRFAPFADGYVMRGLWVHKEYRGRGAGGQLLLGCKAFWSARPCYCFAYSHLEGFYLKLGFEHPNDLTPAQCQQQLQRYRRRGEDLVLLQYLSGS